jgi:hypothetical protein
MNEPRFKAAPGTDREPDPSGRRRSQRVVIKLALLIRAKTDNGETSEIQAFTLVVNAHGGLLQTSLNLLVNQEIVLVQPLTWEEAQCRVVRTERSPSDLTTAAFEFREPTARFWPISFPPEDWAEFASKAEAREDHPNEGTPTNR